MLNQRQLAVHSDARHCQSTENIQKIIQGGGRPPPPPPAPHYNLSSSNHSHKDHQVVNNPTNNGKKKRSLFSFKSTYGKYDLAQGDISVGGGQEERNNDHFAPAPDLNNCSINYGDDDNFEDDQKQHESRMADYAKTDQRNSSYR